MRKCQTKGKLAAQTQCDSMELENKTISNRLAFSFLRYTAVTIDSIGQLSVAARRSLKELKSGRWIVRSIRSGRSWTLRNICENA